VQWWRTNKNNVDRCPSGPSKSVLCTTNEWNNRYMYCHIVQVQTSLMLLGCCADSVLSVEKLSKVVPFLRCPLNDWTDDYGADSLTTEVSQLNCSDNAQSSHVHMLVCASVFQFGMRMYVNSCNDDSCHSIMWGWLMPVNHVMMTHASHSVERASASKAWCLLWLLHWLLLCWNAGSRQTSNGGFPPWRVPLQT